MVQIWDRCKPLQLISPVNTDHTMFIWKSEPVSFFSTSEFKCYCIIKFVYVCLSGHSKFDMDWNLFLQNCFYIKLLIIMFIRMFDVQYWKYNNICNSPPLPTSPSAYIFGEKLLYMFTFWIAIEQFLNHKTLRL